MSRASGSIPTDHRAQSPMGTELELDAPAARDLEFVLYELLDANANGGKPLPWLIAQAGFCHFQATDVATVAHSFANIAITNLIAVVANKQQQVRYLPPLLEGRWIATMAIGEPQTSLHGENAETCATLTNGREYRINGIKQSLLADADQQSENIVYCVLARTDPTVADTGILSLFLVPSYYFDFKNNCKTTNNIKLITVDAAIDCCNTTNRVLEFGDSGFCYGELLGPSGRGLELLSMLQTKARIGAGQGAIMLAYRTYRRALQYARQPKQPASSALIEYTGVKRKLMASKVTVEGGFAVCMYAAKLIDQQASSEPRQAEQTHLVLEILSIVIKVWWSEQAQRANNEALQILGEQYYHNEFSSEFSNKRSCYASQLGLLDEAGDSHALDLLSRRLLQADGCGLRHLIDVMRDALLAARGWLDDDLRRQLRLRLDQFESLLPRLQQARQQWGESVVLAHASAFIDLLGRLLLAWIWLCQATVAKRAISLSGPDSVDCLDEYRGKICAWQYVFDQELPQIDQQLLCLSELNPLLLDMSPEWF